MSLQHKQFWNRSSIREGSLDKAAVVVQRLAILVSHIERRIRFGMEEKQSSCKLAREVQKSKFRAFNRINFPTMLSFRILVDLKFKTWHAKPPWQRSLKRMQREGRLKHYSIEHFLSGSKLHLSLVPRVTTYVISNMN